MEKVGVLQTEAPEPTEGHLPARQRGSLYLNERCLYED